jgi:hypothetical protein
VCNIKHTAKKLFAACCQTSTQQKQDTRQTASLSWATPANTAKNKYTANQTLCRVSVQKTHGKDQAHGKPTAKKKDAATS